jgi:hypothetical protein
LDARTAQAFVTAARHVIDAMLIEGQRVRQTQTPAAVDYGSAELSREAAPGGWMAHEELRGTVQKLGEAIAAEKWTDGVLFAIKALSAVGAL